jgi:tetratricopeptide (TPR) repeat protein
MASDAVASGPAPAAAPSTEEAHWDRVHQQLDLLAQRLAVLEQRLAAAPASVPLRTEVAPTTVIDTAQLRRSLDEIAAQRAHERYAAMDDQELLAEVGRLQWKGADLAEAEVALRQLLARDLDADQRANALTQLGMLQRQRKDMPGSERTLQAVVDERGMRDKAGSWAAYQLAWTLRERDPSAALGVADALAQQAGDAGMRTRARWTAARLSEEVGDVARARADYEALLLVCGDGKEFADVAKDIRYRLERLNGR